VPHHLSLAPAGAFHCLSANRDRHPRRAEPVMRFTLGSPAPRFQVHNPDIVPAANCPSVSGTGRVPMLKLDFLGHYDFADMLMLAASVVVVVSILIAI
jgi:hypothetical protein